MLEYLFRYLCTIGISELEPQQLKPEEEPQVAWDEQSHCFSPMKIVDSIDA